MDLRSEFVKTLAAEILKLLQAKKPDYAKISKSLNSVFANASEFDRDELLYFRSQILPKVVIKATNLQTVRNKTADQLSIIGWTNLFPDWVENQLNSRKRIVEVKDPNEMDDELLDNNNNNPINKKQRADPNNFQNQNNLGNIANMGDQTENYKKQLKNYADKRYLSGSYGDYVQENKDQYGARDKWNTNYRSSYSKPKYADAYSDIQYNTKNYTNFGELKSNEQQLFVKSLMERNIPVVCPNGFSCHAVAPRQGQKGKRSGLHLVARFLTDAWIKKNPELYDQAKAIPMTQKGNMGEVYRDALAEARHLEQYNSSKFMEILKAMVKVGWVVKGEVEPPTKAPKKKAIDYSRMIYS